MNDDETWMRRALDLAKQGQSEPGASPIGCVIVRDGQVIGEGFNEVEKRHDCTSHAEIVAIRRAGENLEDWQLRGATLYSTLQPCGMCSMASIWAKVSRVVFGAGRDQVHKLYFEDWHVDTLEFFSDAVRGGIDVKGGVLAGECAALYYGPDDDVPVPEQANI
jgi:tRNA(adenine34) deaminase